MPEIRLLDQATINQIAAGAVVERPASVVKELFENSIDAKATAVTVEIRDGGLSLIRVTDNGCGIERDQVPIAFKRHATSKIRTAMDLVTVSSLGFRGEALSSIAAVADVEMITKPKEAMLGVSYRIADGEEKGLEEIGAPDGTTILVRDLFGHVPARLNFMKSPATEGNHIAQLMENLALSRPDLSVRFLQNGQNRLYSSGNGRLKDLIYQIYGREISKNVLEIECETRYFKISGYLGKPIISRGNRTFETYFINGRFVKSTLIYRAIETAYKSFMMQHRYPFTVLHITIDPEMIDVNVHPAKLELRFREEETIFRDLVSVIENTLHGKQLIQDVELTPREEKKETVPRGPEPFEQMRREAKEQILPPPPKHPDERYRLPAASGMVKEPVGGIHRRIGQESRPEENRQNRIPYSPGAGMGEQGLPDERPYSPGAGTNAADRTGSVMNAPVLPDEHPDKTEAENQNTDAGNQSASADTESFPETQNFPQAGVLPQTGESAEEDKDPAAQILPEKGNTPESQRVPDDAPAETKEASAGEQMSFEEMNWIPPLLSEQAKKQHRLLGQIFDTYWLIEYRDKLYIMDQHAAHEKILYEKLSAAYQNKERLSQMLNPSILIRLSPLEAGTLERYRDELFAMGYEVEETGGGEYALSGVPADLYGINEKELFLDILTSLSETQSGDESRMLDHRIATMACKAAVKGGMKLSFQEADALISELLTLKNPYACPHGRPTLISISRYELEKKFKRVV